MKGWEVKILTRTIFTILLYIHNDLAPILEEVV